MCVCVCAYCVTQSCLTLCNRMDCSPPGSSVHRILQARILEWVAMPSSRLPTRLSQDCLLQIQPPGLVAQLVKNPPSMHETLVQFLGRKVPLEKG